MVVMWWAIGGVCGGRLKVTRDMYGLWPMIVIIVVAAMVMIQASMMGVMSHDFTGLVMKKQW